MQAQTSKIKPHPDVVDTTLPTGEVVLLQLETKSYYSLNATGSRIWKLLGSDLTLGQISQKLEDGYEVTSEDAWRSVSALIADLAAAKLVIPGSDRRE